MSDEYLLQSVSVSLSLASETMDGAAATCLRSAASYVTTRSTSRVQEAQSLYMGLCGDIRKRVQSILIEAAEQAAPMSAPFDPDAVRIRADLLSIGNVWGAYNPYSNLATALDNGDIPNSLYTREEILLATLHHGFQWDDLLSMVQVLLDAGTDSNCQEEESPNWTPLHYAAKYGDMKLANLLLEHGARLDIRDAQGDTPADMPDHRDTMASCFASWQKGDG